MVKDFPDSPIEKILKKAGKEVGPDRVAESAVRELKVILFELSEKIGADAVAASHHAKRVTIKREDVMIASR